MSLSFLFGLSAVLALVPAVVAVLYGRPDGVGSGRYWLLGAVGLAGLLAWSIAQIGGHWPTGISGALWVSVSATLAGFMLLNVLRPDSRRLAILLLPYLLVMALAALIVQGASGKPLAGGAGVAPWLAVHVAISVGSYAAVTLAAIAGLGVLIQDRAVRRKRPTGLSRRLPAVAEGESLQVELMATACVILFLGILTGMAIQYVETGTVFGFDHKILLSVLAFLLVALLLFVHARSGVRGRGVARWALTAYLLLTLAYPGVKFVTDVLLV